MVFEESPLCVLRSKSENHNGCIVYLGVQALVDLLAGRPRGTTNLAGPCVVKLEVDPMGMQHNVVQHVMQHLALVGLDEPILFQQHALLHAVPCFLIIAEQY